jgi:DNA-binding CsgD family transcriptional regulator
MDKGLKEKILKLRNERKSYNEIAKILNCSKAIISYHCQRYGKNNIGLKRTTLAEFEIEQMNEYYKTHTTKETAEKFNVGITTVKKYVDNKRIELTEEEKKKRNYCRVKSHRQKNKQKAVEYKGGKCEKCGYNKSFWSLEFHHIEPGEKDFTIGNYTVLSWEKIKKELDKCILVCANCHGEIHEEIYNTNLESLKL